LGVELRYVSAVEAGVMLRRHAVGLVPTETVVGLVAGESGLSRLSEMKARDPRKPIALLCGSAEDAFALAGGVPPPLALSLAERFWPGPLTLVLDARDGGTVGVRVPAHPTVLELLASYGGPVYATSANLSGEEPPRALEEVSPSISGAVDLAVEGEPGGGEASAVVDLSGSRVRLLRPTEDLGERELSELANQT
jgi:L-threonylcarbamoyladenylate synthase